MGGFSNFALSFSIISVLTGAVTLYGHGISFGGPLVMSVGWPLVTVMTLTVAASMAQLASSFPTAGALYHWASILGGKSLGWFTAWLNCIGQFAITAGIDYGLAEFVAALLGWPTERATVIPIYATILVSHGVLNHVGVRVVAVLNWLSAWYHIGGVALLVGALLLFAPLQSPEFLLTQFTSKPFPFAYAFLVGLLQAQWTFTGYDASAHATEETVDPSRTAPWGIFLSVAVSGVVGLVMLLVVTLAIGNLRATADATNPFIHVLIGALGDRLGTVVVWIVVAAMWFCGLSSVTSNSRMLWAFARDGGLPASSWIARVSPRFQSPHVGVWVSVAAALVVALWADAYAAMVALSTLALYASYGLPIAVGLMARRRGRWKRRGPWDLGRFSTLVNVIAIAWILVIAVLFVLPPNERAGYTFAACIAILAVYWYAWMRVRFRGPPIAGLAEAEGRTTD
ncbi:MAG: amino acid permease [Deltaproteobacteria bacterium]|nr:amino acid permease [Deltaproteobacteria bacterium]